MDKAAYKRRSYNWKTAIGLQQVDGLVPSRYLIETANASIEGKITLEEARRRVDDYYINRPSLTSDEKRNEEADKVASRIAQLLAEDAFTFSPVELQAIHSRLFTGLYDFAGHYRTTNISKKEWVLNDDSVQYASFDSIAASLDYDFAQEKAFVYSGLNERDIVLHIARFIADIWQIHGFSEGNTRTLAVFTIKYLQTFAFNVENDTFEKYSWYFRNALVRANYTNIALNVHATTDYLMLFFGNLLFGEKNELKNRYLKIAA